MNWYVMLLKNPDISLKVSYSETDLYEHFQDTSSLKNTVMENQFFTTISTAHLDHIALWLYNLNQLLTSLSFQLLFMCQTFSILLWYFLSKNAALKVSSIHLNTLTASHYPHREFKLFRYLYNIDLTHLLSYIFIHSPQSLSSRKPYPFLKYIYSHIFLSLYSFSSWEN
jgi:hypothetical protein